MAVGTSSITIREIYNEINSTSHGANAQIGSGVSMSSLRSTSIAYTGGAGSSPNVQSAPDRMNEWSSYTHSQSMGTITYLLRTGTSTASYGMRHTTDAVDPVPEECTAEGGMFLTRYSPSGGGYTKIYGDVMKTGDLDQLSDAEGVINRRYAANGTYATMGSFANNTSPTELISIPVEGVTLSVSAQLISGTGTGFADNDITGLASGHTIIAGSAKGADDAEASGNSSEHISAYWKYTITASKTGYNTTVLTPFVAYNRNQAASETGE